MSNKKITPFELSQALNKLNSGSVFDQFVKEVEAKEIPARYVEYMTVFYHDGNSVEITGSELSNPIPVNKDASWNEVEDTFRKVKNVRVFIDTRKVELDVTKKISKLLDSKLY